MTTRVPLILDRLQSDVIELFPEELRLDPRFVDGWYALQERIAGYLKAAPPWTADDEQVWQEVWADIQARRAGSHVPQPEEPCANCGHARRKHRVPGGKCDACVCNDYQPVAGSRVPSSPQPSIGTCLCGMPAVAFRAVLEEGFSLPVCSRHAAAALVAGAHSKEKVHEDLARMDERDSSLVSSPPQPPAGDK